MNYYKQGDAANADKIKAAFENKGFIKEDRSDIYENNVLFFTVDGDKNVHYCWIDQPYCNIVKTHPDYQELELPAVKFKVGDWIHQHRVGIFKIIEICESWYEVIDKFDRHYSISFEQEKNCTLWSIADAKEGDVLATDTIICIFKKLDKDGYIVSPCIYTVNGGLEVIDDEDDTIGSCGFKPATKEDRELLFRKMKEAGYQWDAEKKELELPKPHYDISNFHAGMPVLVRETNLNAWQYVHFSHCYVGGDGSTRFNAGLVGFTQCIPFEGNEYLLGTTEPCGEEYINW